MKNPIVQKYGFRIRTRNGAIVDNLLIAGRDAQDAQRKLMQMYHGCEILGACSMPPVRTGQASYEEVMNMITAISQ
ncbi:MAG: hypothetical protein ACM3SV_03170 [Betaproteobacteria bacterium]